MLTRRFFGTHLSVGGCQLTEERLLYSSDICRSQFKVLRSSLLTVVSDQLRCDALCRVQQTHKRAV
jgi:hypothetical protein